MCECVPIKDAEGIIELIEITYRMTVADMRQQLAEANSNIKFLQQDISALRHENDNLRATARDTEQ